MEIRRLPQLLVDQIAAGEVIDRPASVVKETIENAIDAGATRIDVTVESGGTRLIKVVDDGAGIPTDQLPLAVAPHATSKIRVSSDLDAIATMGFRGEALASIGSVAELTITSRPPNHDSAHTITVDAGVCSPVTPAAAPPGTSVTIRNLFARTPARRKFLKSDGAETARINQIIQTLAMAHPGIAFSLTSGERSLTRYAAMTDPIERVATVVGEELRSEFLLIDAEVGTTRLTGVIGRPSIARGTSRHLRIFLNGRSISDATAQHAVREGFRGLIDPRRFPTAILFLEVDPQEVDVNVHPAKTQVRFRDRELIHSLIRRSIRRRLEEEDLVPDLPSSAIRHPSPPLFGTGLSEGTTSRRPFRESSGRFEAEQLRAALAPIPLPGDQRGDHGATQPPLIEVAPISRVLQVHASYLVCEDEEGLVIIDQHALHERFMFEKFMTRLALGPLESQQLLTPAIVDVDPAQMEALETLAELLTRLGIEADPMGPRSIGIRAFPSLLLKRKVDPITFMATLLDKASDPGAGGLGMDEEAALHQVVDMMACKAAIKAGDRLSDGELAELVSFRHATDRATACPHGRPTSLKVSLTDLEKHFGR